MKVINAQAMGMCFGVKDALAAVMTMEHPERATVYGQLVHNGEVLKRIRARGFSMLDETDRSPAISTPNVVITAHGLSDRERRGLEASGKTVIDTTCPLVRRVHQIAGGLHAQGYFVVVAGRRDHVEVQGIVGDLERFAIVERPEDIVAYPADRIAVVCQTTTPPALLDILFETIAQKNAGKVVRLIDTICGPTSKSGNRQSKICYRKCRRWWSWVERTRTIRVNCERWEKKPESPVSRSRELRNFVPNGSAVWIRWG